MRKEDVRYIVNEEKKTVVAIIEGCQGDLFQDLLKLSNYRIGFSPEYLISDTFKASTKCLPEDDWDVENAKKIALSKLMRYYYSEKRRVLINCLDELYDVANIYENLFIKFDGLVDHEKRYFDKLSGRD